MPADHDAPLPFPLNGLNVTKEFQLQPPGTTSDAENVRAKDSIALRGRGGSRPGLSKYVDQQVPAGAVKIQHVTMIVDPTVDALTQVFRVPDSTWVEHPRFPGIFYPPGGSGDQPNPNAGQPAGGSSVALDFEQSIVEGFASAGALVGASFSTTPGSGSIIFAIVVTNDNSVNTEVTVENGAGNPYTQIGTYQRFTKLGKEFSLSVWYRIASDGASEIDIDVTPSSTCEIVVGGMEWSGPNVSPIGDTSTNSGNAAAMTTGNITVGGTGGDAVMAVYAAGLAPDTVTPSAGYTLQIDHNDGTVDSTDIQLYVIYQDAVAAGTENPSATFAGGADDFLAFGISIRD